MNLKCVRNFVQGPLWAFERSTGRDCFVVARLLFMMQIASAVLIVLATWIRSYDAPIDNTLDRSIDPRIIMVMALAFNIICVRHYFHRCKVVGRTRRRAKAACVTRPNQELGKMDRSVMLTIIFILAVLGAHGIPYGMGGLMLTLIMPLIFAELGLMCLACDPMDHEQNFQAA